MKVKRGYLLRVLLSWKNPVQTLQDNRRSQVER